MNNLSENRLKLIALPLGHLEDITIRSLTTLFTHDYIFTENTKNYGKLRKLLLSKYLNLLVSLDIKPNTQTKVIQYTDYNHDKVFPLILEKIRKNLSVCYISDAGMPTISDPGYKLVRDCIDSGIGVEILPGPTAFASAIAISGLPTDKFTFLGFLPRKKNKIQNIILENKHNTIVFYESPKRLLKTLEFIAEMDNFYISASNDLTKKFEMTYRGRVVEVLETLRNTKKIVGEWTVVLSNIA